MITWETQLSPVEIREVACFVQILQGTTPAKPKEPQGDLYVPADTTNMKSDTLKQALAAPSAVSDKSN